MILLGNFGGGTLTGYHIKQGPVNSSHCREQVSPGKLNNPVPTVRNHTVLDNETEIEDESKTPVGNRKHMFWQTLMNDQRLKLKVNINDTVIEELPVKTGESSPESWHLDESLQKADISIPRNWNLISSETKHKVG